MSPEDALKVFEMGLLSSGYVNFGNDLPKILKKRLGLDLVNDPTKKLLRYHWNTDFIGVDRKDGAYYISFTQSPIPTGSIALSSNYLTFEAMFPLNVIADRIKDIDENTLLVKATKEDGAKYSEPFTDITGEQEYTFLKTVVSSKFIRGFWKENRQFLENPNFNHF